MRPTIVLFLTFGFSTFANIFAQDSVNNFFKPNGALIMAVRSADGIVMVADSRLAYKSQNNEVLAYQDGMPKIYPLKKFALGICGDFSDGTSLIKKIILDFEETKPVYRTPEECLYKFGIFTKEKYPRYFKNIPNFFFICAGYGPEPMIAILLNGKTYPINQDAWASNVFAEIDSLHLFNLPKNASSKQAAETATHTLKEYISIFHKENEAGSLFSVLKINVDNSWHWMKNDFTDNDYMTECEIATALYNKKIDLYYTSDKNEKLMENYIKYIWKKCK